MQQVPQVPQVPQRVVAAAFRRSWRFHAQHQVGVGHLWITCQTVLVGGSLEHQTAVVSKHIYWKCVMDWWWINELILIDIESIPKIINDDPICIPIATHLTLQALGTEEDLTSFIVFHIVQRLRTSPESPRSWCPFSSQSLGQECPTKSGLQDAIDHGLLSCFTYNWA